MFEEPARLLLGLASGIVFGFLLQKGQAAKYHVILGQFLLKNWTVVKIMVAAIAVGSIGVYALIANAQASLQIRPFLIGGVLSGAVLFGIGIVLLGYCPGTSVAACGQGSRDAMLGVLGMLTGAVLFVGVYPFLRPLIEGLGNLGEITIAQALEVSPWILVAVLVVLAGALLALIEFLERRGKVARVPERPSYIPSSFPGTVYPSR